MVLEARVVDAHLRRARGALAREVEVAEREAVEVERVALLKWGVEDIRLFYENDLRFLEQFGL